jgi:hypothetical protein
MITPASVLAALLVMMSATRAQDVQTPPTCKPWPACSILKSPLNPGAPTPGLRPQEKVNTDGLTDKRIDRNMYRLPTTKESKPQPDSTPNE